MSGAAHHLCDLGEALQGRASDWLFAASETGGISHGVPLQVTLLYTAPTAIRALQSFGDSFVTKYSRKTLRILGTVGEPINPEAWKWYHEVPPTKLPACHGPSHSASATARLTASHSESFTQATDGLDRPLTSAGSSHPEFLSSMAVAGADVFGLGLGRWWARAGVPSWTHGGRRRRVRT